MRWPEFQAWAERELGHKLTTIGVQAPPEDRPGGSQVIGRVLDVGPIGTGHSRDYGPRHQRRLRFYVNLRRIQGWRTSHKIPDWFWGFANIVETWDRPGYLVIDFDGTYLSLMSDPPGLDITGRGVAVIPWPGEEQET